MGQIANVRCKVEPAARLDLRESGSPPRLLLEVSVPVASGLRNLTSRRRARRELDNLPRLSIFQIALQVFGQEWEIKHFSD